MAEVAAVSSMAALASVKLALIPTAYYTSKELSEAGYGSELTHIRAEQSGKLRACRIGRKKLFKGADVIAWIEGRGGNE